MGVPSAPPLWVHFLYNLLLQIFDAVLTYQVLALGVPEANPLVGNAIAVWGEVWGLLYWKALACLLLFLIFALRHTRRDLAVNAFKLTAAVYGCVFFAGLYQILFRLPL